MYDKYNIYLKDFRKKTIDSRKNDYFIKSIYNKNDLSLEEMIKVILHAKEEMDLQYDFKYELEINTEDLSADSNAIYLYDGQKKDHKIIIFINNILKNKNNDSKKIIQGLLNSFYHEYRHMMFTHIIHKANNYNLSLFQITIDRLIFRLSEEIKKIKKELNATDIEIENLETINYYNDIYKEHQEEKKCKTFALNKTIDFLEKQNIEEVELKYLKQELGKEISNDKNNHFYSEKTTKNRLEYALEILDKKRRMTQKFVGDYPSLYRKYLTTAMPLHELIKTKYLILSDIIDEYEENKKENKIEATIIFEEKQKDLENLFDNLYLLEFEKDYCKDAKYLNTLRNEIIPSLDRVHSEKQTKKVKNEIDMNGYIIPTSIFEKNKKLLEEDLKRFIKLEKRTKGYIEVYNMLEKQQKTTKNL
jgi:hypothetical protein